jgi:uncharacterized protein
VAAVYGNVKCAKVLIAAGADVNNSTDSGITSLHLAINHQYSAVVQLLLEHGATAAMNTLVPALSVVEGAQIWSRVSALVMCTEVQTLKALLAAGADVHVTTHVGDTCLHLAVANGYPAHAGVSADQSWC